MSDTVTRSVIIVTAGSAPDATAIYIDGRKGVVTEGEVSVDEFIAALGGDQAMPKNSIMITRETCNVYYHGPCIGRFNVFEMMTPAMYIDLEIDKPDPAGSNTAVGSSGTDSWDPDNI